MNIQITTTEDIKKAMEYINTICDKELIHTVPGELYDHYRVYFKWEFGEVEKIGLGASLVSAFKDWYKKNAPRSA